MYVNHVIVSRIFVIILLSTLINCKSVNRREVYDDMRSDVLLNQPVIQKNGNISVKVQKEQNVTNQTEDSNVTETNHAPRSELHKMQDEINDVDSSGPERDKRRPITQITLNNTMIENFRNKLRAAGRKLQEMKLKAPTPTLFVIDPNQGSYNQKNYDPSQDSHRQIIRITNHPQFGIKPLYENYPSELSNEYYRKANTDTENEKANSQISLENKSTTGKNVTEIIQNENESKEQNLKQTNFALNDIDFEKLLNNSLKNKDKSTFPSDGLEQLVEIREEINKLRSLMQVVKEQQMKEHFSNAFSQHLKPEEQKQLKEFVEKLKQRGQISTIPNTNSSTELDSKDMAIQNNQTVVLTKDIKNLRMTVLDFMKKLDNEKLNSENLEKLEREFVNQQEEIENLKTLLEKLVPQMVEFAQSNSEISDMEERNNKKERLHNEILNAGNIFDDFSDEDDSEEVLGESQFNQTKNKNPSLLESQMKKDTSDEDLDFMKIFQKITNSRDVGDAKSIESKIEKLERDLKDLENLNHRTRQEMLLEKLERDIKNLKPIKENENAKIDKQEISKEPEDSSKSINIAEKLEELQKQIKLMSRPETRDLNDAGIEKELSKLQEKIDKLGQKRNDFGGFQEHLTPPGEDFESNLHVSQAEHGLHGSVNHANHFSSKSYVPSKYYDAVTTPNVFQLPFCLQRTNQDYSTQSAIPQYMYIPQHVAYPVPDYPNYKLVTPHSQKSNDQHDASQNSYDKNLYFTPANIEAGNAYKSSHEQAFTYRDKSKSPVDSKPISTTNSFQEPNVHLSKLQESTLPNTESNDAELKKRKIAEEIKMLEETLGVFREQLNAEKFKMGLRSKRSVEDNDLDNVISKLENRIHFLRNEITQLPNFQESINSDTYKKSLRSYGNNPYETSDYYKPKPDYSVNIRREEKFDKLFIKLLKFVLHKVGISGPYIFDFLFGSDFHNDDYGSGANNQYSQYGNGNDVQYGGDDYSNSFNLFGLSGFLPTIFFRLLSKIPQFIRFLQRNVFIRNFLVPGGVILIVNGILAFLVWWFFPSDFNNLNQNSNYLSSYSSNYNVQPYYS